MNTKTVDINLPVLTRVEGEGGLDLQIVDGRIERLKLRIFEPPRYFEKLLEGRDHREVADIVARICGICPVAYQMSAVQALESVFDCRVSDWVQRMRRVMYCGEWIQSHSLHVHLLALPDFLGFASAMEMAGAHAEVVRRGLRLQALGNDLIKLLGGRSVHPVGVTVGGFSKAPSRHAVQALHSELQEGREAALELLEWLLRLELPRDEQDFTSVSLYAPDHYPVLEGRIVSDAGLNVAVDEFDEHMRENQVPHSTALHAHLHDEPYLVGPLARLNHNFENLPAAVRDRLTHHQFTLPSRNMFASIIARAAEIALAMDEACTLLGEYEHTDHPSVDYRVRAGTGAGCSEAPRGLLWHRYEVDAAGAIVRANIVPPTSQNQARMEQDIATGLNNLGLDSDDAALRQRSEMIIRNYDPCISCSTHFLRLKVQRR